jgi:hypothetical protein
MKYPFQKKSFWIILVASFVVIFFIPPYYIPIHSFKGYRFWDFFWNISYNDSIHLRMLIFEMVVAFLLNYLGHLIFSKPETK